jgi:HAD superfamily hydrolase (TIGR01509 family)
MSFVLALGFSVLLVSAFSPNRVMGLLMAVTVLSGIVGDLVLLPALMKWWDRAHPDPDLEPLPLDLARVRLVSWDVDGTLYDMDAMLGHLARLALRRGLWAPWRWAGLARELRGLGRLRREMDLVRAGGGDLSSLGLSPEERAALAEVEARWTLEAIRAAGPRPEVAGLLDAVGALGLEQVVLSDHPAREKLAALGVAERFAGVHEGEGLGLLKPHPDLFRAVCREAGVEPDALLHVGDREDTDGAAAAVGAQVVVLPRDGTAERTLARLLRALTATDKSRAD